MQTNSYQGSLWLPQINLQNALLLLSSTAIALMFYVSYQHKIISNPTVDASISPPKKDAPFSVNSIAATQQTQNVSAVVTDALAFYNMLSSSQQSTLQLTYTSTLARKWSNLPCGTTCRNGLQLGTNLTTAQYAAAMQIVKDALNTSSANGYDEFHQLNLAEAYLHANGGGSGYDSTLRWMAFLGTPSTTGAWMLQFGGHHYAANIAINNGHVIGATPFFTALEPKTFTYNGVSYDPLGDERDSFRALFASLSSTELTTAKLSASFSDCVMIPGESNGGTATFPSASMGIALSSLTTAQQNLALAVIQNYVGDMDATTASSIMVGYTNEISQTYISWRGSGTAGSASSFLVAQGDYMRISGPNVWIEFSCQGGIVIQGQIHYHTIWRDRSHDYGVDLAGDPIDNNTTSISQATIKKVLNVYPNPSQSEIRMDLPETLRNAKVFVTNINGKVVYKIDDFAGSQVNININSLAQGNYFITIHDDSRFYSGKFIKQ